MDFTEQGIAVRTFELNCRDVSQRLSQAARIHHEVLLLGRAGLSERGSQFASIRKRLFAARVEPRHVKRKNRHHRERNDRNQEPAQPRRAAF
jgi:hypothetical protein